MKKLLSLFPFLVLFLFSCTNFQNTNSISVSINGRDLARSAARDVAPISDESGYFVTAAIRGDFNQSQTAFINPNDECVFVFDYVPLNSEVYAEINVFQRVGPNSSYEPSIQIFNGKSETITVSPGENYLPLALNPLMDSFGFTKSNESALIQLYQNGKYYIQLNDGGVISEGLWRCSEAFGAELGPFGLEQSFTLYLTEYVYGKIKEQYSTTPVIIELPEEKAVNVKYDGNSHRFSFEGKSGYNFVVGDENNDDPPPQTYSVNILAIIQNGSVTSDHTNPVEPGTTVTITVTPNLGYKILNLLINGQSIPLSEIVANQYAFKMPEDNVSVSAAFEPIQIPAGFVLVQGQNVDGSTYGNTPASNVFVNGRTVTINNFYMCEHEVTKKEYETYCRYSGTSVSGNDDKAVYYVSWYDAIVYCNLRSLAEERTPVYSISGITDPKLWDGKQVTGTKYYGPSSENSTWNG
ncbi:MAG: hypothetical protein IKQ43_04730, partial [Treponema sp.]|nr:hypothetical protein [Treponema sp.]